MWLSQRENNMIITTLILTSLRYLIPPTVKCMIITAKRKFLLRISDQCFDFILPKNTRKPNVFWFFQGI